MYMSSVKNNIGNFGWKMCMSDVWWTSSWVLVLNMSACDIKSEWPSSLLADYDIIEILLMLMCIDIG